MTSRTFYTAEINRIAGLHKLDPDLVEAVVIQESSGDPHARRLEPAFWKRYMQGKPEWKDADEKRWSASLGLMQIMPTTAMEHGFPQTDGPEWLFRPEINLEYGCRILKALLTWSGGKTAVALAAYNGGKGGIDKTAPKRYAASVLKKRAELKGLV